MPTNLDALIRYKTLDQCFATGRRYTLEELANRCSEALSEKSGSIRSVSTRTIQDDIRVMRSDMLAFNAPIEVMDGLYYYGEAGEYVFSRNIHEQKDLRKILEALIDVQKETKSLELFYIVRKLNRMTGYGITDSVWEEMGFDDEEPIMLRRNPVPGINVPANEKPAMHNLPDIFEERQIIEENEIVEKPKMTFVQKTGFCWEEVMEAFF